MKNIGQALLEARIAAGLSRSDLALLLGITGQNAQARVWEIEKGKRPFRLNYLYMLPEEVRAPVKHALIEAMLAEIEKVRET